MLQQHGRICIACRDCNPHLEGIGAFTLQANLSQQGFYQLCSTDCRISFLRKWIQAHLQECTRIGAVRAHLLMMFLYKLCHEHTHWGVIEGPRLAVIQPLQDAITWYSWQTQLRTAQALCASLMSINDADSEDTGWSGGITAVAATPL